MNLEYKKPLALRFNPDLIRTIDRLRPATRFETRTAFIQEACFQYCKYIQERLGERKIAV